MHISTKKIIIPATLASFALCAVVSQQNASALSITDGLTINPYYQQYLNDVAAGHGDSWKLVPNKYISTNHNANRDGGMGANSLPSRYNLVEAGYATPIKNQGNDGICWAYAATTVLESNLKLKYGTSVELSPKQLDYLLANDTPYSRQIQSAFHISHALGEGGSFELLSYALSGNHAPVSESSFFAKMKSNDPALANYNTFKDYNDQSSIIRLFTGEGSVYNKAMSNSLVMGEKSSYNVTDYVEYGANANNVETIKQHIMNHGATFVGTFAPNTTDCYDASSKTIVDHGTATCGSNNGHAMAIVGWDDNHTYSYPGVKATGTGAFILQNSYGYDSLLRDYGITSATIGNFIDISGLTEDQKAALFAEIDNYEAPEFVYLSYDSVTSLSDSIAFANIEKAVVNDWANVHELASGVIGTGENINEATYTYTANGIEYIDSIALAMNGLFADYPLDFTIYVDNGSGFNRAGVITVAPGDSGQKSITLDQPIRVSGDFKLKFAVTVNGTNQKVALTNETVPNITMTAYTRDSITPAEDTPDDSAEEIPVPNTGLFTGDKNGAKLVGIITLASLIAVAIVVVFVSKNHCQLHFHKVNFKKIITKLQ